jgi:hypothetical protein
MERVKGVDFVGKSGAGKCKNGVSYELTVRADNGDGTCTVQRSDGTWTKWFASTKIELHVGQRGRGKYSRRWHELTVRVDNADGTVRRRHSPFIMDYAVCEQPPVSPSLSSAPSFILLPATQRAAAAAQTRGRQFEYDPLPS